MRCSSATPEQGRVIVTENRDDFADLADQYAEGQQVYTGILRLPNSIGTDEFGRIARAIVRFEREHPEGVPPLYFDYLRADDR
jgi:nucleoside-diphosphate-sugar epimerase